MSKTELHNRVVTEPRPAREGRPAARSRRADGLYIAIFALVLLLPSLGLLLPFPALRAPLFGELPAAFPRLHATAASVTAFPAKLYQYLDEHFAFRRVLLRRHALLDLKWLHASPSKQVVLGKDGWLYYAGGHEIESWRRTVPFYPNDLDHWQQILHARQDWLAARGIKFLFVICPDKQTIYPEYWPYASRPPAQPSRLEQLAARLRADPEINFLDLRPVLLANKPRDPVYYRLDSHWTDIGALLGARQIAKRLRAWYPQVVPPSLADFSQVMRPDGPRDLADLMGLAKSDLHEPSRRLVPKQRFSFKVTQGNPGALPLRDPYQEVAVTERPGAPIPRVVVLRDSFAIALVPYLSQQFGHATYVWTNEFDRDFIAREKPDVVIWEMVERDLMKPVPQWARNATRQAPANRP